MKRLLFILLFLPMYEASYATIAPITGKANVCVASPDTLNDATAGGVWSSSNIAVATVSSSMGVVTGIAAGMATITYTVGAGYQTKTVVVNPFPSPIYGSHIMCAGNTITLYDSTAGGGTWYYLGDDEQIIIINSGAYYVNLSSSLSISTFDEGNLHFTDTAGCSTTATIWAYAPPLPPITGDSIINVDSTTGLADIEPEGIWSSSDTSVATIGNLSGIVTGMSPGTITISYTYGCTAIFTLTVISPASVPVITASNGENIWLYPNPTSISLTISAIDKINIVTITNVLGQTVYTHDYHATQVQVDVADLPPGIYLIRINGTEVRKFVKQ